MVFGHGRAQQTTLLTLFSFLPKNLVSQGQRDPGGSGAAFGRRRAQQITLLTNFFYKNLVSQGQRDPGGSGAAFGRRRAQGAGCCVKVPAGLQT